MKRISKILTPLFVVSSTAIMSFGLTGCNKMTNIKQEVLDEFIGNEQKGIGGLTSVPRPCEYHDKIVQYLKDRIIAITPLTLKDIHIDAAHNIYIDLPASKGLEDKDMVILQGHSDMVVAGMTEQEKTEKGIEVELEGNLLHSKDYKTSIGADDGAGVAIMLYLAKNAQNFKHGPLRFLFTADEDCGMIGASKLNPEWLLDPEGKYIKWLINIDAEHEGCIYSGCAGNIRLIYSKSYSETPCSPDEFNTYDIYFDSLKGGHSATDILNHRANADKLAFACLLKLIEQTKTQIDWHVRLVGFDHKKYGEQDDVFYSANQLIANSHMTIAVNKEFTKDNIRNICNVVITECCEKYSEENAQAIKDAFKIEDGSTDVSISDQETENLANVFGKNDQPGVENLSSFYYGIFDELDPENELPVAPALGSSNVGPLKLIKNDDSNEINFDGWTSSRCAIGTSESPVTEKWSVNWVRQQYYNIAQQYGININAGPIYYPWIEDEENELIPLLKEGFKKSAVDAYTYVTPGGVECSWWMQLSDNNIKCACVGSDIENAHSIYETLDVNTIESVVRTILYTLDQLAK